MKVKLNVVVIGQMEIDTEGYEDLEEAIQCEVHEEDSDDIIFMLENKRIVGVSPVIEPLEYHKVMLHVPPNSIIVCPDGILKKSLCGTFYKCEAIKLIGDGVFENIGHKEKVDIKE